MDTEQKETKLAELQSSVNSLVDSNLYQAKLIQAMHKILLDAGIECGSKEIVAGMRYIESLKQQRDEFQADAIRYRWLVRPGSDTYAMFVEAENKAELDAAIDRAIAKIGEQ